MFDEWIILIVNKGMLDKIIFTSLSRMGWRKISFGDNFLKVYARCLLPGSHVEERCYYGDEGGFSLITLDLMRVAIWRHKITPRDGPKVAMLQHFRLRCYLSWDFRQRSSALDCCKRWKCMKLLKFTWQGWNQRLRLGQMMLKR